MTTTRREALVALSATALIARAAEPLALTAAELAQTARLTDLIIPRTETPGASDAQVPIIIDERAAANPKFASSWKAMLQHFAVEKDPAAAVERAYKSKSPEFKLLKETTIDIYYATQAGLATELGWHGNTYLPEFRGCDGE